MANASDHSWLSASLPGWTRSGSSERQPSSVESAILSMQNYSGAAVKYCLAAQHLLLLLLFPSCTAASDHSWLSAGLPGWTRSGSSEHQPSSVESAILSMQNYSGAAVRYCLAAQHVLLLLLLLFPSCTAGGNWLASPFQLRMPY